MVAHGEGTVDGHRAAVSRLDATTVKYRSCLVLCIFWRFLGGTECELGTLRIPLFWQDFSSGQDIYVYVYHSRSVAFICLIVLLTLYHMILLLIYNHDKTITMRTMTIINHVGDF